MRLTTAIVILLVAALLGAVTPTMLAEDCEGNCPLTDGGEMVAVSAKVCPCWRFTKTYGLCDDDTDPKCVLFQFVGNPFEDHGKCDTYTGETCDPCCIGQVVQLRKNGCALGTSPECNGLCTQRCCVGGITGFGGTWYAEEYCDGMQEHDDLQTLGTAGWSTFNMARQLDCGEDGPTTNLGALSWANCDSEGSAYYQDEHLIHISIKGGSCAVCPL